jgi:hypothetical protein
MSYSEKSESESGCTKSEFHVEGGANRAKDDTVG